jgi:DNA-directed RNA polymerase specialized sigma24 family protein
MTSDATAALPAWRHDSAEFAVFTRGLALGEDSAWHALFDEWYLPLVRLVGKLAGTQLPVAEWEDRVCEAVSHLAQVLRDNPSSFDSASKMHGWLATVARRRTVDAIRRRTGRAQRYQLVPIPEEGSGKMVPSALIEHSGLDDESETDLPCAQLLRILVEALPIRDQEIFLKMETDDVLAKRYELTTQQVADIRYKRTRTLKRQVETSDEGMTTIGGANR